MAAAGGAAIAHTPSAFVIHASGATRRGPEPEPSPVTICGPHCAPLSSDSPPKPSLPRHAHRGGHPSHADASGHRRGRLSDVAFLPPGL